MAYNKAKNVEAAEKYLHQGKIAQAIGEYQQILKQEPKDQVMLMTVGDLYVRQGETFQALEYFDRLARIFIAEGFVSKAIAIYKKIAKLAPEETRPVERLAELYVQQGVLSEARPIYLQLAEAHQRAGRQPQAQAMLHKLLEAEPDNVRVQVRLAELSLAMGQPAEAVAAFRAAAEVMFRSGEHAEAVKYADRALKTDPDDLSTLALKARTLAAGSHRSDAMALLQSLPGLDESGEAAELLIDLYLEAGEVDRASDLAAKIMARRSKQFAPAHHVAVTLVDSDQPERALPLLDLVREAMTDAGEHEALSNSLVRAVEKLPGRIEPLEWLVELYGKTSDSFHLPDAMSSLAEAYEAAGQHERAQKVYQQLLERGPENDAARRHSDRLRTQLGLASEAPQENQETAATPTETPLAVEPPVDEETQRFVTQALIDVDLFSSYGLTQKAVELLENVLQRAPEHTASLERLLDIHLGEGDERRIAELAAQLKQLHAQRGNSAASDRFAELQHRFEHAAGLAPREAITAAPAEPPAPVDATPAGELEPAPVAAPEEFPILEELSSEADVHEVDLSEEWASLASQLAEATGAAAEADVSLTSTPEPAPEATPAESEPAEVLMGSPAEAAPAYELELDPLPPASAADDDPLSGENFLQSLSSEFAAALPELGETQQAAPPEPAVVKSAAPDPVAALNQAERDAVESLGPLNEMFDEFRAEMDDLSNNGEDLETHYNLGIAYREMGLLDEAISEFQKVAKASKTGEAFRYSMQCCTLLGLAFMEKGQPAIAAMWYERALEIPGLDQESVLALRYDLGVAQEMAGDTSAARRSFSQVYGMNIDYRDVAERLAALGKGI